MNRLLLVIFASTALFGCERDKAHKDKCDALAAAELKRLRAEPLPGQRYMHFDTIERTLADACRANAWPDELVDCLTAAEAGETGACTSGKRDVYAEAKAYAAKAGISFFDTEACTRFRAEAARLRDCRGVDARVIDALPKELDAIGTPPSESDAAECVKLLNSLDSIRRKAGCKGLS